MRLVIKDKKEEDLVRQIPCHVISETEILLQITRDELEELQKGLKAIYMKRDQHNKIYLQRQGKVARGSKKLRYELVEV